MEDERLLTKESQTFYLAVEETLNEYLHVHRSLKKDILQNVVRHILRVQNDGKRPQDVLGHPEKVLLDVKRQLEKQQKVSMFAFIGLFIAWLLVMGGLYALYRGEPVVIIDIRLLLFAFVTPFAVVFVSHVIQRWDDLSIKQRIISVALFIVGTLLAVLFLLLLVQTDWVERLQIGLTPWFSLISGLAIVIVMMRNFRGGSQTRPKQIQRS